MAVRQQAAYAARRLPSRPEGSVRDDRQSEGERVVRKIARRRCSWPGCPWLAKAGKKYCSKHPPKVKSKSKPAARRMTARRTRSQGLQGWGWLV